MKVRGPVTHGHIIGGHASPTYITWHHMIRRCRDPKFHKYEFYGARGIKVCERWLKFQNFLADMGERPEGKTLDRFPDNRGGYEPGNCRWATPREQQRNTSNNLRLTHNGETKLLVEWAEETGIPAGTLRSRLRTRRPDEVLSVAYRPRSW